MKEKIRQALSSLQKNSISDKRLTESAVLVPIFCKGGECHILFTQRSNQVSSHKGQASFPGGTHSEGDMSLLDTAIRESWEEIGLEAEDVEILGELDDIPTTTGFVISPFVGFIPYPYKFIVNHREIDEIFDMSVSTLLHKADIRPERYIIDGQLALSCSYEYGGRRVWGATARILKQFLEIFQAASGAR